MKSPLISSKKISLQSDYLYFDLLPIKKFHECTMRIPETIILQKGFIKDWIFNSHKIANHPILKKKRENLTPFLVIKAFCIKNGYAQHIQGCNSIRDLRDRITSILKQQKDYDFVKDKKVIEVTTTTNEVLLMTLSDLLDYAAENKYAEQNFYEKWKMIQEKVCFTKIDEFYKVQNVRNNHVIESKCQKMISVNTTEATIVSSQIEQDPYKKTLPAKNFQIAETKSIEGYKFFDTFLNKKFFQMSSDLIQFIQKNMKCLVESVVTRFVINKDRQPFLVGIYDLEIKPAKKIADNKQFFAVREKGYIKIEEYQRCLQTYIYENEGSQPHFSLNRPISQTRKKCRGKFCNVVLQNSNIPAVLQHKLSLPSQRSISSQLRDGVIKRRLKVLQKLQENKMLNNTREFKDQSSEYQSEGQQYDHGHTGGLKSRSKNQLKVCQNCFIFYYQVSRFFQIDMYNNLIQKKAPIIPRQTDFEKSQSKQFMFKSKQQLKKERSQSKLETEKKAVEEMSSAIANKKWQTEQNIQHQIDTKPITISIQKEKKKSVSNMKHSKSNTKILTPLKIDKSSMRKTEEIKSDKNIIEKSKSKLKLDPLDQMPNKSSLINHPDTKGYRLLSLTKLSQPIKLVEKQKLKNLKDNQIVKQKRPQNHREALDQLLRKLRALPDSSKQELIFYAKKYYKDNLPQPIERRSYSTYYEPHLYQFMSLSPISIHPKRRIKKRPEMSLKRLSQLTDYPQIVSRSQFIFDTVIINEQTTISFCVLSTKNVSPDNIKPGAPFQNIFIVNDLFDCFIEHISTVKELLQEDQVYNKRIILFNYPGQSHTIYNKGNNQCFSIYFSEVLDKLIFRLSSQKNQLKIIDLQKDTFKFCGFGYGGFLLATYLSSYADTFSKRITGALFINSFMQFPKKYVEMVQSLLQLYKGDDPTVKQNSHLFYNKAIGSEQVNAQQMDHKSGLNPIRIQDRVYLLQCLLKQYRSSITTTSLTIEPQFFEQQADYQCSIIYSKNNSIIPKQSTTEFLKYRNNPKKQIEKRVLVQISGGHDTFADNYQDIFRLLALFARK